MRNPDDRTIEQVGGLLSGMVDFGSRVDLFTLGAAIPGG